MRIWGIGARCAGFGARLARMRNRNPSESKIGRIEKKK